MNMNKEITDYFNVKKSNSVAIQKMDPKKQCEEPTIVDNVFNESLWNPDCLAILSMFLQKLENQVNSIFKESADSEEIRIKRHKQLQDIND